ncbi:MAG TPA: hypothetical protein VHV32_19115 [Candidatus Angelobacter sp.]|jgi:hypothetical protein|nr:hypothetical protein [Candidatus Angelobacter sp.]
MDTSFESFWKEYPRKVAKHYARQIFARLTPEEMFAAIHSLPIHVKYWKLAGRELERIPHASTWLSQHRWEDELEMPEKKSGDDWMRTTAGIAAKAKEVGIEPKAGEDWYSLKTRILARAA